MTIRISRASSRWVVTLDPDWSPAPYPRWDFSSGRNFTFNLWTGVL